MNTVKECAVMEEFKTRLTMALSLRGMKAAALELYGDYV